MRLFIYILTVTFLSGCAFQKSIPTLSTFDDIAYPFPTKKVTLPSGEEIAYFDEGQGQQTILFIHGLGSYAPAWQKNIEDLRTQYRCIAIDLPGYGKSSKGKYEASMQYYAQIVHQVINTLALDNVVLAGHSMGGQISITTALAYPDQIKKLLLVAPAGFETFSPGQREWFRTVLTPTAVKLTPPDAIKENIAWNFYNMPSDAQFMITDRIAMRKAKDFDKYCYIIPQCVKGMVDAPVFDYLPQLQQPTFIVFGQQDNLIPNRFLHGGTTASVAQQGAAQIPNHELLLVDKAGHFVHYEQAAQVNAAIRSFLK